jgi:hypothetical protein
VFAILEFDASFLDGEGELNGGPAQLFEALLALFGVLWATGWQSPEVEAIGLEFELLGDRALGGFDPGGILWVEYLLGED